MSTVTTAITTCPNFQAMLIDNFQTCNMSGRPDSPLFMFLNSPANRSNLRDIIAPRPGKKRVAELIWDQPILPGGATTPSSWDMTCSASTERGDMSTTYEINYTDAREFEERINLADWNASCRDNGELILGKINRLIDALMTSLYAKVAGDMPPLLGGWASTVTVDADDFLEVATEKAGNDDLNPAAYMDISIAKMKTGYCAPTFIVGGTDLFRYYQFMRAGCCTQDGVDALAILAQQGEAVTYDHWVETEFGGDVSLMLQTGSVQLLHYNGFSNALSDVTSIAGFDMSAAKIGFTGVILDPRTGYPIDISIREDCNVVSIVVRALAKPVSLPFDMFGVGSVYEGVNWAAGIQVVNT